MGRPTDDEIMRALCCGGDCLAGPYVAHCHRWDFVTEVRRVRELLDRHQVIDDREGADQTHPREAEEESAA